MRRLMFIGLCCFILALSSVASEKMSYEGYKVIKTEELTTRSKIYDLINFVHTANVGAYDFWVEPRGLGKFATIMVKPDYMEELKEFMAENDIKFNILIEDVEETNSKAQSRSDMYKLKRPSELDFTQYYGTKDINNYMEKLARKHKNVDVVSIGCTYEDRYMKVIEIKKAGPNAPIIWIEAGIHAREWIAPAMATYIMHSLLEVEENAHFLNASNYYILPSANPDGYEFSRSGNRLWRKTRSVQGNNCFGVDPNRNWAYHWHESGVSNNPCSDTFPGTKAFSEPETRNIKNYVEGLPKTPLLTLCLHSAANLWLYPYGYALNAFPKNIDEIKNLAMEAVDALNSVHGAGFRAINSAELYPAAGASDDWYMGTLKSRFSYTVELRQGGPYGFDLPEEQIIPSGEELWEAFKVVIRKISQLSQ